MHYLLVQLAISGVTERYGLARRPSAPLRSTIETFLLGLTVFPRDSEAAQRHGDLRAALEREVNSWELGYVDVCPRSASGWACSS